MSAVILRRIPAISFKTASKLPLKRQTKRHLEIGCDGKRPRLTFKQVCKINDARRDLKLAKTEEMKKQLIHQLDDYLDSIDRADYKNSHDYQLCACGKKLRPVESQ